MRFLGTVLVAAVLLMATIAAVLLLTAAAGLLGAVAGMSTGGVLLTIIGILAVLVALFSDAEESDYF